MSKPQYMVLVRQDQSLKTELVASGTAARTIYWRKYRELVKSGARAQFVTFSAGMARLVRRIESGVSTIKGE